MMRPGVPTMTWAPRDSARNWITMLWPPYTGSTWKPGMWWAYFWKASATWIASSRVGVNTSACGIFLARSSRASSGSAKAAVLPVPVCASPSRSFPARKRGMHAA